jgi:polyisoprenoid-binding protein YceI
MPHHDAATAECLVFTFKEGLLSKTAHDLELRVGTFSIDVAREPEPSIEATFDAASIEVATAMHDGRANPGALSSSDFRKIEASMRDDVLHTSKHREVRFRSTRVTAKNGGFEVRGDLTLHGTTRAIVADVREKGGFFETEVVLHQPDFGITPYKAMLGTLKIKPDVRVRVRVPAA